METEPYKSLQSVILEVQTATRPAARSADSKRKPEQKKPAAAAGHKAGEVWQTASGSYGAKNKDGVTDYFDSEDNAKAWVSGQFKPAGRMDQPGDTSTKVELDADGYEVKKPTGAAKPNAKPTAAAGARPAAPQPTGGTAPKAQAAAGDTKHQAQPQGQQASAAQPEAEENPEVARDNPKTEWDSEFKEDPKATEKIKAKPDIRKAHIVSRAIKQRRFSGPQSTRDSVFGDPEKERRFIEELNHAALAAMRGERAYDFELCAKAFSDVGFCYDAKSKKEVTKGIPRDQMPQFSSQVDPSRKDSEAFKALMAGKGYTSPDQVTPEDLKAEVNMEKQFRAALEAAGYTIEEQEVNVTELKPIQGQLKGEKIAGMYGTLLAAQEDETYAKQASRLLEPIYVSDGYVIDGHHRWAAQCAVDIANGSGANTTMKTRTITKDGKPVPVEEIIKFSNKFQKDIGLLSQTRGGETIPEKKPAQKTQKEWAMGKFGSKRTQNLVESLNEAAKQKFKKPKIEMDQPNTFGVGAQVSRKTSVADKRGIKPISIPAQVTRDARAANAVARNEKTAADLMKTIESKPEGTTIEIYGSKNGKEISVKVKKVRKMGDVVYLVGNSPVELRVAGTGLQVIDKKNHRVYLDRGNDMIWESEDLTDVGRETIMEFRRGLDSPSDEFERKKQVYFPYGKKLRDSDLKKIGTHTKASMESQKRKK
jgi:hypothetical protein